MIETIHHKYPFGVKVYDESTIADEMREHITGILFSFSNSIGKFEAKYSDDWTFVTVSGDDIDVDAINETLNFWAALKLRSLKGEDEHHYYRFK